MTIMVRDLFLKKTVYIIYKFFLDECLYELQYDIIDVSEGIDLNKTSISKKCDICHYWYFKDVGYKFQLYVCNGCHGISVKAYQLKNIAVLNAKGADFRCVLLCISKNDSINRLNNSVLEDRGVLLMDFGANKTPVEIIKEDTFGGTYFRDIYSGVNGKWYKKSWKEFDQLEDIDIIAQIIMMLLLINMMLSVKNH